MKINIIAKSVVASVLGIAMASCSSDYLDLKPVTSVTSATVYESVEGAREGMYGICNSMYMQYGAYESYFLNGESSINALYGDVFGQDCYSYFWTRLGQTGFSWGYMNIDTYIIPTIPWMYCYGIIGQCNQILYGIDDAIGKANEVEFVKAQVLTLRAHAYTKLLQFYAPRWEDSNNGAKYCVVYRVRPNEDNAPLATMNEVLDLIYSDLTTAIELYDSSNGKRTFMWEPNISVAQGVLARAAMIKHDWHTAKEMAAAARKDFPIMSGDQYLAGFNEANQEWMWCNPSDFNGIYYWAFGSVYACNGAYPVLFQRGAGAINYELYRQMDKTDIRRALFWTPDKPLKKPAKAADFWSQKAVNSANMNMNGVHDPNMTISVRSWAKLAQPAEGEAWPPAYCDPKDLISGYSDIVIQFGAHSKFWAVDNYGTGSFPYMRGAEMLLIEAEASAMAGDASTAQKCLTELNAERLEDYTCDLTGQQLIDEVRLNRRIELWGEGFNFFDFKRWNLPIVRNPWIEGDVNSNNIPSVSAKTLHPADHNGWRYAIPRSETQYNTEIDQNLLR